EVRANGKTIELMTSVPSEVQLNGAGIYRNSKVPYIYNYVDGNTDVTHLNDTQGEHGSHVAGIAAANRYIKKDSAYVEAREEVKAVGMAPDAQLLIMKVFGQGGGAADSDYMAAIEDAIVLGADSINLSLGSSDPGFTYDDGGYQAILNSLSSSSNLKAVVTISAGNNSSYAHNLGSDLYVEDIYQHTGGSPGSFINSLGTASADNIGATGAPLQFGGKDIFYLEAETRNGAAMTTLAGTQEFVYIDAVGTAEDYQTVNSAYSLKDKIVIINRGSLSFIEKANNLISYSPKALIIANNAPGSLSMSLDNEDTGEYYSGTFPVISITQASAGFLRDGSAAHTAGTYSYYTGSITVTSEVINGLTAERKDAIVSDFSAWGIPGSLLMKPEITAPGGDIYSVYGTNKTTSGSTAGGSDQYELMSGTSMAAPHMAGLAAVVAQYLRENPVADRNSALAENYTTRAIAQSLLMSTATPMINDGNYVPILQQGSGLAEVSLAVSAPSVVMVGTDDNTLTAKTGSALDGKVKIELGDDPKKTGSYQYSFTIHNISDEDLVYELDTELFTQGHYDDDGLSYMDQDTISLPDPSVTYRREIKGSDAVIEHDVDQDGSVGDNDAQAILDLLSGSRDEEGLDLDAADMDGDGEVTSYDAYLLLNYEGSETGYPENTVKAHDSRKVTVTIELSPANKNFLDSSYPNGAYLEGFTYASGSAVTREGEDLSHEHSIPILGFYGNWTDPSMFDSVSYIEKLYGSEKETYSGVSKTNYLTLTYNGIMKEFTGNPYTVEDEFPESRLAVNSTSKFGNIFYNLIRSAGTTGLAVSEVDEEGLVTDVLASSVSGNNVLGLWYNQHTGTWQNVGTKFRSVGKTAGDYGLAEGDRFRIGFYAIPEYDAMLYHGDDLNSESAGMLGNEAFRELILGNSLGKGAYVGYDFIVDDSAPKIGAALEGNTLSIEAIDNFALAYVAVLSLDGEVVYAETAPGTDSYVISLDASDAIANAQGYVAAFAGDYAGNEKAVAIKVNDNNHTEKTVYVQTDTVTAGEDYLIVNTNTEGTGYSLSYTLNTSQTTATVARSQVAVKSGNADTGNRPYIETADAASTAVWTAGTGSTSGTYTFNNNGWYLRRSNSNNLAITKDTSRRDWVWDAANNRLSINTNYYLRYYNNTFSLNTASNSVYMYRKTTISYEVDPYEVSSITMIPNSLNIYKGNEEDLSVKVSPMTAPDRSVAWSSSNTSVAAVDETGHVTGVGKGDAIITATSNSNPSVSAEAAVHVESVSKSLNGIVWDEEGGVYFSGFNANALPSWNKLHNDAKSLPLQSAFMQSSSTLYAATLDTSSAETVLYSVNRSSYALTEYGVNYLFATDMALAATTYAQYVGFAYTFGPYLVAGPIAPGDDGEGGTYSGLPYAALDCSEVTGDAYFAGIATKARSAQGGTFYILDENGVIWLSTLALNSAQDGFDFTEPTKVIDTGIGTSFLYQTLYYDGTYLYWGHTADDVAELIIINPSTGAVYHAGDFGESVWPVVGFYTNGSVAPSSIDDEVMDTEEPAVLEGIEMAARRDELLTDKIRTRFADEAARLSAKQTEVPQDTTEPANEATGSLDAIRGHQSAVKTFRSEPADYAAGEVNKDDKGNVTVTFTEEVDVTNGLFAIAYDPDMLTYVSSASDLSFKSINVDEEKGVITFAYAAKTAVPADTVLLTLTFTVSCEDTKIEVITLERNDELGLSDSDLIEVAGLGHEWGEPSYVWAEDNSSVTASRVCANDDT
ncbi:MAG: S8 family serine peptidase, partial [Erysipelotrichaceae bacterium]|nr:S8 family serine peptidase [Erysipelotrichaceae bacterium]